MRCYMKLCRVLFPILCVALLVSVGASVLARQRQGLSVADSILIGSLSLTLDMAQDQVLRSLANSFDLVSAGSIYNIFPKGQANRASAIGSVHFANGILVRVSKDRPIVRNTSFQASRSLYFAVLELTGDASCQGSVSVNSLEGPTGDAKSIFVSCGRRYVHMQSNRSDSAGEFVFITEVLE